VGTDGSIVVCICNLSPVPRTGFRVGLPVAGSYSEVINTDAGAYGGSNIGNMGTVEAHPVSWHGLDHSSVVTLPPLATIWLRR
jgi:1,4-alpha-glucan branching enzyme